MILSEMTKRKSKVTLQVNKTPKDHQLDNILDKINIDQKLSEREEDFLKKYDSIDYNEMRDFNYLSLLDLFYLISKIKKIINCDIKDKSGKINDQIMSFYYNYSDCQIVLTLKHGTFVLNDNYLYKLTYEFKHDNYSLDIESEYNEKIEIEK